MIHQNVLRMTIILKKIPVFIIVLCLISLYSCKKESRSEKLDAELEVVLTIDGKDLDFYSLPESNDFSEIPQDANNPITPEKVELGQFLFHETALAMSPKMQGGQRTYSCASCHFAGAGFQAGRFQGIGDGGMGFGINGEGRVPDPAYPFDSLDVQPLRSPAALNTAYQELMLWNGQFGATGMNEGTESEWTEGTPKATNNLGYEGLEIQAIAGLKVHRLEVSQEIVSAMASYKNLCDVAFADTPEEERYNFEHAGLAIAAYERTLLANEAPFQKWLKGDKGAMTEQEKSGAILFFDKAKCNTCHTGPALNTMAFEAIGMNDLNSISEATYGIGAEDQSHLGRGSFTQKEEDNYKFKVPQLYNLKDSPFYGHGSSFRNIREVVAYKNNAVAENEQVPASQLSEHFKPLNLTDSEIDDITAFIENALRDPNLNRYVPNSVASGMCFPNNDEMSQKDLGCD